MMLLLVSLHDFGPLRPHELWHAWNADPLVIAMVVTAGAAYTLGLRRLWAQVGEERGVQSWQVVAFGAALTTLVIALLSPLDALADALFSAHMAQHLLLILVAPPLLVLSAPTYTWLWALPNRARRRFARVWTSSRTMRGVVHVARTPLVAWTAQALVLVFWHVPYFYDAAVRNGVVHAVQHASYVGTAVLFWSAVLHPTRRLRRPHGAAVLYLFGAAMQGGALGALLTLGVRPWYAAHVESAPAWSLTPLEDQQIAGAIMWVPGGLVYLIGLAALILLWLRSAAYLTDAAERRSHGASHARSAAGTTRQEATRAS